MLNEVPDNNNIKNVENMVNEAPVRVTNNVRLTTMGTQQFSMVHVAI